MGKDARKVAGGKDKCVLDKEQAAQSHAMKPGEQIDDDERSSKKQRVTDATPPPATGGGSGSTDGSGSSRTDEIVRAPCARCSY